MSNDDLSALIFELQRARTPGEKARALARAWRTVRGLNSVDRRMLAREVGFEGAEELVDGLAGKGGGVFAPAAVLEALSKMRRDEGMSIRGILADLRDPQRRDDLLVRGIDLVADSLDGIDDEDDAPPIHEEPEPTTLPPPPPGPEIGAQEYTVVEKEDDEDETPAPAEILAEPIDHVPTPPELDSEEAPIPNPEPPRAVIEPQVEPAAPSVWDRFGQTPELGKVEARLRSSGEALVESFLEIKSGSAGASVRQRLRAFRESAAELRGAQSGEIAAALDALPEPWARRRAVVALIEAGFSDGVDEILDIIEDMDRPMDRRWCLAALARSGELDGAELDRALGMLVSPAAKRRIEGLASRGR